MLKKKGFTLLELIIVIIIIGILSTLGITQYGRVIERSRSAEARIILGAIRSNAAAIYLQNSSNCTNCTAANIGIGGDYPGPAAGNCNGTSYFWFNTVADASTEGVTVLATRCVGAAGKQPGGNAGDTVQLQSNFTTGNEVWTMTGRYL